MYTPANTRAARQKRHRRIRKRLSGTGSRPRLCVFRSLHHIYAQVIDDATGRTLAAASSLDAELRPTPGNKSDMARVVGKTVANRAQLAGVNTVVFDRGGYLFHGRVKALAEAAREQGLEF
jgi:large subunit ribosomal protein L18